MKVFCNKCKYCCWSGGNKVCKKVKIIENTPCYQDIYFKNCDEINTNNSCKNYKPKWYISFAEKIKKKKVNKPVCSRSEILDI